MSTDRSMRGWLTRATRSSGSVWVGSTATANGASSRVVSDTVTEPAPSFAPNRRSPSSWTSSRSVVTVRS